MSIDTTAQLDNGGASIIDRTSRFGLREYITGTWVIAVVAFTIGRVAVVGWKLEEKGVNIWVFGFIDLITAVPYAIGVAKVVTSLIDRQTSMAMRWAVVAVVSFFAPYVYVAWCGRDSSFPAGVWIALGVLITVFGANALWGVYRKVRDVRVVGSN